MESVIRVVGLAPAAPRRTSSDWSRTVLVIRVPRFSVRELAARKTAFVPENPLDAFTPETEIRSPRRSL